MLHLMLTLNLAAHQICIAVVLAPVPPIRHIYDFYLFIAQGWMAMGGKVKGGDIGVDEIWRAQMLYQGYVLIFPLTGVSAELG